MNKFLVSSDWHLRSDRPRCRVDDWHETQVRKLEWLVELINSYKVPMLVAGDLLDSGTNTQYLENLVISILKKAEYPIITIPGNHDLPYHSMKQLNKSTYWVLHQAGVIQDASTIEGITGVSYGEVIPEGNGILMCHRLVFPSKPPEYLQNAISSKELLELYDYDIILSGDNHQAFYTKHDGKTLINGGGLFRQDADKKFINPKVYLFDFGKVSEIDVPINIEDVQQEYLLDEHERNTRINAFVEKVKVAHDIGLSFKDNMESTMNTMVVNSEVKELIFRGMKGDL